MNITPIFKLLSDETRLRVTLLIASEELCVCEICGILGEQQSKISKILSKLRDMNLVSDDRREKYVFYKLVDSNQLLTNTFQYINENLDEFPQLKEDFFRLTHKEEYIDKCVLAALKERT